MGMIFKTLVAAVIGVLVVHTAQQWWLSAMVNWANEMSAHSGNWLPQGTPVVVDLDELERTTKLVTQPLKLDSPRVIPATHP